MKPCKVCRPSAHGVFCMPSRFPLSRELGQRMVRACSFSMLDLVWRLAFHTEDHPGDDLYDAVYFSTRSSAVTSLNRLLLRTPNFHHWLAQQRVANS